MGDGWTALHLATAKGNDDIFMYILQKLGADPTIRSKTGITLMHKAAMDGNSFLITYLRQRLNFRVDDLDFDGN